MQCDLFHAVHQPRQLVCRILLALLCGLISTDIALAKEEKRTGPSGLEYYLYTPANLDATKSYWLVVGVHGAGGNGKGAAGMESWIAKENVIVVGPSFPNGYQVLELETDRQLVRLFTALQKEFKLYPKLFIYGFSGGSQYAHRFALRYPKLVIGCAAHSGGTWNDSTGAGAAAVPFAISCGESDTALSTSDCPMNRIDWAKQFAKRLASANFYFKARFWPGIGHGASPGSAKLTEECFYLATTGMYDDERKNVEKELDGIKTLVDRERWAEASQEMHKFQAKHLAAKPAVVNIGMRLPPLVPTSKPGAVAEKENAKEEGNKLPKIQEDEHGWHENEPGKLSLESQRRAYLEERLQPLLEKLQKSPAGKSVQPAVAGPAKPLQPAQPPVRPPGL